MNKAEALRACLDGHLVRNTKSGSIHRFHDGGFWTYNAENGSWKTGDVVHWWWTEYEKYVFPEDPWLSTEPKEEDIYWVRAVGSTIAQLAYVLPKKKRILFFGCTPHVVDFTGYQFAPHSEKPPK